MSGFDPSNDDFIPVNGAPRIPFEIRRALIRGKQTLLRDESNAWRQSYLPKLAAIAAQLRREARRTGDARPHLKLARRFDELAMQSPREEPTCDEEYRS